MYADLIPEAACLFGTVANSGSLAVVEINSYDEIAVGQLAAEINLSFSLISSFHVKSDQSGDVSLSSSFQFETIEWIGYEYANDGSFVGQTSTQFDIDALVP